MKFKLSKFTWVVSGHAPTLNKPLFWWKVQSKKQRKLKETLVSKRWSNSGRKMKKKKKNQRQKGDGRWLVKWRRYQKSGSDSRDLGIFFFFYCWFTLYRPIFIFRPISGIFPETAGTSRYLERNETAIFLFRPKHWYGKFRPVQYGIDFLD